jgi:hypothetical protein
VEGSDEIDITEAAQRLGVSWHRAWRAVLMGSLKGRREGRAWKVDSASVERLRRALLVIQPRGHADREAARDGSSEL